MYSHLDVRGKINSILIPLFGSRTAGQHPQDVADQLFRAACVYFEQNTRSVLKRVYFLAYTHSDRQFCDGAIGSLDRLGKLVKKAEPGSRTGTAGEHGTVQAAEPSTVRSPDLMGVAPLGMS